MKLGLAISAAIVILFAILLLATLQSGNADPPTRATAGRVLEAQSLPSSLPVLYRADEPEADATPLYRQAIGLARQHRVSLLGEAPAHEEIAKLADLITDAAESGRVEAGFLDRGTPVAIIDAEPEFGDAVAVLHDALLAEADRLYEADDTAAAGELALALFMLGQRAFERNTLLENRYHGLSMMESAGSRLYEWEPEGIDPEAVAAWGAAITTIHDRWDDKLRIVRAADPHVGDLVNIALRDADPTFRVAATLRLGVARFNPGSKANLDAIDSAINQNLASDHPLVAEAAKRAEALTLEEMRRYH